MNPKRTWASLLICLLAVHFSGCASLPGWMSASKSQPSRPASNIETQLDIARLHEHQKKFIQARKMYLSILEHDPENIQAYHRLAVVLTRQGKPEEAILNYQRAVELDPENSELLSDFGYTLFLNDDLDTAEEALLQAIAIDSNHKRSIGNLAIVRGHQGYLNDCLSLFRRIVPEAEAYANLAYIHVQRGEGQLAIQRYGQALSLDDNLETAAEALVQIAKIQNRVKRSVPGLSKQPAPDSYVATAENFESFATETAETQTESPNTETQGNRETDSPTPEQWWNQSADLVLAGASTETTTEDEIAAEKFPDEDFSVDEASVDQIASDEFSAERDSVAEQSFGADPANKFSADEFVPAPHSIAENSQDDQFEAEFDDSPGVIRIGSNREVSDDFHRNIYGSQAPALGPTSVKLRFAEVLR